MAFGTGLTENVYPIATGQIEEGALVVIFSGVAGGPEYPTIFIAVLVTTEGDGQVAFDVALRVI